MGVNAASSGVDVVLARLTERLRLVRRLRIGFVES
jgi:hypothetical protein